MTISPVSRYTFRVGVLIVLVTHIYMLVAGGLPSSQMMPHAVLNLVAGVLIIVGWVRR